MLSAPSRRCWGSPSGALHHWVDQRYSAALCCVTQWPCVVFRSCPVALCYSVAQCCVTQLPIGPALCYSAVLCCATWCPSVTWLSCPAVHYSMAQCYSVTLCYIIQCPSVILPSVPVLHYSVAPCCLTQWPCVVTSSSVLHYSVAQCYSASPCFITQRLAVLTERRYSASSSCRACRMALHSAMMRSRCESRVHEESASSAAPLMMASSRCSRDGLTFSSFTARGSRTIKFCTKPGVHIRTVSSMTLLLYFSLAELQWHFASQMCC